MQKFYDATCTGCYLLGIITIYFQSNSGNHTHTHISMEIHMCLQISPLKTEQSVLGYKYGTNGK